MKILHALYSDRKGGLERAFVNVTTALLRSGHQVEVLAPVQAPFLEELPCSLTCHDFRTSGYHDLLAWFRLRRMLKMLSPDLIVSHNSRAAFVLSQAAQGLGIPHLAFSHGYKTRRFKKVDHLVVLTEDMRQHFISAGYSSECVSIFPNVIEQIPDLAIRTEPVDGESIRLGFVGRLNEEKGLEDLLRAVALLKDRCALELHIAGSGPDQAIIEALAQQLGITSALNFSGWVDDIQSWMKTVDLIIVPSRAESFGIVVLEAAAYGCPVIATDLAGPASQITHRVDGWLAKPGSPESLASVIEQVVQDSDSWQAVCSAAYQRARRYQLDARLCELKKIIEKMIA